MDLYVFGYGSLMNPESLARTLPREHSFSPAFLPGYKRRMNHRFGEHLYLNIVPREDSEVDGLVFPIREHELEVLKSRESGYQCIDISSLLREPLDRPAVTFIAPDLEHPDLTIKRSYILRCLGGVNPQRHDEWLAATLIENPIYDDTNECF